MQLEKWFGSDKAVTSGRKAGVVVSGLIAGLATHVLLDRLWRVAQDSDPPARPATGRDSWRKALTWTAATSVAAGTVRLVTREAVRPRRQS